MADRPYASSHIPAGRKRVTVDLDVELHERLLDAVHYAQAHGAPATTKTATIHRGLELAIAELADTHGVDVFPPRDPDARLRPGPAPGG